MRQLNKHHMTVSHKILI